MRRVPVLALAAAALLAGMASASAQSNPCQDEFQALMTKHQEVMKSLSSLGNNKSKPANFDEARSRASKACAGLAPAVASFERINTWATNNKDFCQLPDKMLADVGQGLANMKKSRANACGAVSQLDAQKKKAEQAGAMGMPSLPGGAKAGVIANDPFNPRVLRRPQIEAPGG